MSVFKKLKDVLFDVEEEEIPVITKEEKKPVREEPKREVNPCLLYTSKEMGRRRGIYC